MSRIKGIVASVLFGLAVIVGMDLVAFGFFESQIRSVFPHYGRWQSEFGRGIPRGHLSENMAIGFDITPDFKTTTYLLPGEYREYPVWGNSYGCFDEEWSQEDLTGGVYLAGDSFTWGYASYEKKFGTILQGSLGVPVFSCGVIHTGQRHQFEKFRSLYESGVKPDTVIVNVTENDPENDFHFPHTLILDGFMVENAEWCAGEADHGGVTIRGSKVPRETLIAEYKEFKRDREENIRLNLKDFLRSYSLTSNVIRGLLVALSGPGNDSIVEVKPNACNRSVYGFRELVNNENYSSTPITRANREAILAWIEHARENKYELIFSLIPLKDTVVNRNGKGKYYDGLEAFIRQNGGIVWRFEDYWEQLEGVEPLRLYYRRDGHFNESGNAYYAGYLEARLTN